MNVTQTILRSEKLATLNPIPPGKGGGGGLMPAPTLNSSQFQTI